MSGNLKLMADYECFPVWDIGPGGLRNLDPRELPISGDLAEALMGWADIYDQTLVRNDPRESGFSAMWETEEFVRHGKLLAKRLAEELGADWSVSYFDDLKRETVSIT